jgi:hypothetical protein
LLDAFFQTSDLFQSEFPESAGCEISQQKGALTGSFECENFQIQISAHTSNLSVDPLTKNHG